MRATGVSIVPIRGKWGLPWIVPKAGDIHVRWGRAVDVGPPNGAPTDGEVAAVLDRYIAELRRLFDEYAPPCLPPEVAKRGLTVLIRGKGGAMRDAAAGGGAAKSRL